MKRILRATRILPAAIVLVAFGCGEEPITNSTVVSTRSLDSLLRASSEVRLPEDARATLERARDLIALGARPAEESLSVAKLHAWTELAAYARSISTEGDAVLRLTEDMGLSGRELGATIASRAFQMKNMADNFAARTAPSDLAEVHRQMSVELREMSTAMVRAGNLMNFTCEQAMRAGVPCLDAQAAAANQSVTELELVQSRMFSYAMARLRATRMLAERGVDIPDP